MRLGRRRGVLTLLSLSAATSVLPVVWVQAQTTPTRAVELQGQNTGRQSARRAHFVPDTRPTVALLIGNQNYAVDPLRRPHQDVERLRQALLRSGFQENNVKVVTDVTSKGGFEQVSAHLKLLLRANPGAVVVFYYSGHAVQLKGVNYLIPTQAPRWTDVEQVMAGSYKLSLYLEALVEYGAQLQLVFLDACRNNPYLDSLPVNDKGPGQGMPGLARGEELPGNAAGTGAAARGLKLFARVQPGKPAPDDGRFADELAAWMETPGAEVADLMKTIGPRVRVGSLRPWEEGYIEGDFYFQPPTPTPVFVDRELSRLEQLGNTWITVPSGPYKRGSTDGDPDERHVVTVHVPAFQMSRTEITVAQYRACVDAEACSTQDLKKFSNCNWGQTGRGNHPLNCVDWEQARAFAAWVGGRLATEAEWEKAARGGQQQTFAGTDDLLRVCEVGNVADQTAQKTYSEWTIVECDDGYAQTAPVGSFRANPLGFSDLTGNVWEWVMDCYQNTYEGAPTDGTARTSCSGSNHVLRGGGWFSYGGWLRAAYRDDRSPDGRDDDVGFRVVRSAPLSGGR